MDVTVNGERRSVRDGMTAAELLHSLSLEPERVVVELNLTVLKRAQLALTTLKSEDTVEIVHFVGGGSSETNGECGIRSEDCGVTG